MEKPKKERATKNINIDERDKENRNKKKDSS